MRCLRLENHEFSRFFFEANAKRNALDLRVSKSSSLQKVSEEAGDRFILTDLVIIYTRLGSSQSQVSLEIETTASLTRETSAIIPKELLKKELTYSSNTFKGSFDADFCCREGISSYVINHSQATWFQE